MVFNSKGNARKELKCNQKSIFPTILTKKSTFSAEIRFEQAY